MLIFLVDLLGSGRIPPQIAPGVLQAAVALQTQNPDLAEMVAKNPEPIIRDQQRIAQMEWEVVINRATAGQVLPTNPDDIHADHLEQHLVDLASFVNSHQLRAWDQLNVAEFAAAVEHVGLHIAQMRGVPENQQSPRHGSASDPADHRYRHPDRPADQRGAEAGGREPRRHGATEPN